MRREAPVTPPLPPGTRVAIVDDDPEFRRSLELVLRAAGLEVAAFRSAEEYLAHPPPAAPECLLLDLDLPGPSGLDLQRTLAGMDDSTPVVFLSGAATVEQGVRAMRHGAVDFLTKPFERADLLDALARAVTRGRREREDRALRARAKAQLAGLTTRELQVAQLVVLGHLNKEIGALLGIGEQMVKGHRQRAMQKLGVESPLELSRVLEQARDPQPPDGAHRSP
jgi:two-component system, LuxR family, response regulator FixJ